MSPVDCLVRRGTQARPLPEHERGLLGKSLAGCRSDDADRVCAVEELRRRREPCSPTLEHRVESFDGRPQRSDVGRAPAQTIAEQAQHGDGGEERS